MAKRRRAAAVQRPHAEDPTPEELLARLGMADVEEAKSKASEAVQRVKDAAEAAVSQFSTIGDEAIVVMGVIARAQGFHEGVSRAIDDGNPYAAFTLLRSYAENAAAISYLIEEPQEARRFIDGGPGVRVGKLTNHATRHFDGFRSVYATLNDYAHPASRSTLASHRVVENADGTIGLLWHSAPRFRNDTDQLMACAWQWELAEAHDHLIRQLGHVLAGAAAGEPSRSDSRP